MRFEKIHPHDLTRFCIPSVVLLKLETAELYLIDKVNFGFGSYDEGQPIDEEKVKDAGFEILGEL